MDKVTPEVRSRIMGRIRGKNTKPEVALRSALHALGVRFRIHDRSVKGTPDISHKGAKVAAFIDGCFWHGCPRHYKRPLSRQEFWDRKLAYNADLRKRVVSKLEAEGWNTIQIWECQIREEREAVAESLAAMIRGRRRHR